MTDTPENLNMYGFAKSPFGAQGIGHDHWLVRNLAGGWQLAHIFSYTSGTPLLVVGTGCTAPSQGTCMPDLKPGREHSIRTGTGYGAPGVTYANVLGHSYLDPTAYSSPAVFALPQSALALGAVPVSKIGDAPRTSGDLRSPSHYNLDAALQRSFNITHDRVKFVFRADCFDVTNKVTFSLPRTQTWSQAEQTNPGSTALGKLTSFDGNRRFQFSGRVTF